MTTRDERKRNWIWGRDMLDELCQDAELPADLRVAAADVAARYPARDAIEAGDGADPWNLEPEHAAIGDARNLFQRIRESRTCSAERRHSLLVILRHL